MKGKFFSQCALLLIFVFFGKNVNAQDSRENRQILVADSLFKRNSYGPALETLNQLLDENKSNVPALILRGRLLYMVDFDEESLADLNQAIALDSLNSLAFSYRGDTHFYLYNFQQSMLDYENAIRLGSITEREYYGLGASKLRLIFKQGNSDAPNKEEITEIEQYLKRALSIDPFHYKSINLMSILYYFYKGDEQGTFDFLNKIINAKPTNPAQFASRAQVRILLLEYEDADEFTDSDEEKGEYGRAIADLESAIREDSLNVDYLRDLASILERDNQFVASRKLWSKANELSKGELQFNYNRRGRFYPYTELKNEDNLQYPMEPEIEFFLEEVYDFDSTNDKPSLKFKYNIYSKYDAPYLSVSGDTLEITDLSKSISLDHIKSNNTIEKKLVKLDWFDSGLAFEGGLESGFIHNWDLRNYPFDIQRIKVVFKSNLDTTLLKFKMSEKFYAEFNRNMRGLRSGFQIDTIEFRNGYENGWELIQLSPGIERKIVHPLGIFEIVISRRGSWLFLKLFLGAFLSCCLSWIAFIVKRSAFSAQIEISIGAIFGAIGNKYFVEATTPLSQVLTKADLINNLAILIVLLNTFLLVLLNRNKLKVPFLNNLNNLMFLSMAFTVGCTILISIF